MSKKDPAYLSFIRSLPCCAPDAKRGFPWVRDTASHCKGAIEAHHQTGSGLALKAPDRWSMPLCQRHHRAFHDARGVFSHWDKARRKEWQKQMVDHYQALHRESES